MAALQHVDRGAEPTLTGSMRSRMMAGDRLYSASSDKGAHRRYRADSTGGFEMRMIMMAALAAAMATGAAAQNREPTNVLLRQCTDASELLRLVPTEGPQSTEYIMAKSFVIGVWASVGPSIGTSNDAEAVFHEMCQQSPEQTTVAIGRQIGAMNATGE